MPVYSYLYSLPYVIFTLFFFLLAYVEFYFMKNKLNTGVVYILVISTFLYFFGFRGFTYSDWLVYYVFFQSSPTLFDFSFAAGQIGDFEIGFRLYTAIIKTMYDNYFFWQFISVFIDVIILHLFFRKYSKYYVLGFIAFIVFGGMLYEINLMRNIKGLLLFLLSIKYIKEKKLLLFSAYNILGALFHISSLLYLPVYFFLNKKIPFKFYFFFFIIGNILFLLKIRFISAFILFLVNHLGDATLTWKINAYLSSDFYASSYGISIGYIERFCTSCIILFYYSKLDNDDNRIFYNAFFIYIFINLYFSEARIFLERFANMFYFSYWILLPALFSLLKTSYRKLLFMTILGTYAVLRMLIGNNIILHKYDNVIFGIESYDSRKSKFNAYFNDIIGL